jgi:hypothetical protein
VRLNRDRWFAISAALVVIVALALGFRSLGGPGAQRRIQTDNQRIRALRTMAFQINSRWSASNHTLPLTLEGIAPAMARDPITKAPYEYHPAGNNKYELCATFATDNHKNAPEQANSFWRHAKGHFCFTFDPAGSVENEE